MLRYILLILCNILAIMSTIEYVRKLKLDKKNENIIAAVIIYFFRIIVFENILGYLVKWMNYYSITLCFTIEFVLLYIVSLIRKDSMVKYIMDQIRELNNKRIEFKFDFNTIITIVVVPVFCIISFIALTIYEYSYDGNYYHLSHIIDYIQQARIYQTNNSLWNNVYPQNIELLNMFYMMFTYSIKLVRIPQIVFCLLGSLSIYLLMKELSFNSKVSYRCAILYFLLPFVFTQITTTYIDAIGCTIFILLLYLLIRIFKTNKITYELLYFITLSIFMGIKGTYVIYAVVITIIYIFYKLYMLFKKKEQFGKFLGKELIFLLIVLSIGCTWMIQNIFLFKNPIHPFGFLWIDGMEADIDIGIENEPYCLKGKNNIEKVLISWIGLNSSYLSFDTGMQLENLVKDYDSRIGGLGVQWMYFLVPCIFIAIIVCLIKKYKISKEQLLVIFITALCFILTPANWWGRYVGYIIIIGYICYGIIDEVLSKKKIYRYTINVILLCIILLSIAFSSKNIISRLLYTTPYSTQFSDEFRNYIETGNKNIVVLEESYYKSTISYVFLKGSFLQNCVDTYYIENMYPNPMVKNHGIESYENFEKIINSYEKLDAIIILDADSNRKNYEYLQKFYEEKQSEYSKKEYGEGIIVYEKVKK